MPGKNGTQTRGTAAWMTRQIGIRQSSDCRCHAVPSGRWVAAPYHPLAARVLIHPSGDCRTFLEVF
jgi:hypothetical protein